MPLTKEQLLIPRVMCVGGKEGEPNYPGSQFKVGQVLTQCVLYGDEVFVHEDFSKPIYSSFAFKFPHLFRPMPWWYGRKPEEMPDWVYYISMKGIKEVRKVIHWEFFEGHWMWKSECGEVGNFFYYKDDEQYQPATEQEYLEYQNRKINQ